jgi:hypothetical protein
MVSTCISIYKTLYLKQDINVSFLAMFCGKLPPIRHGKWVQLDEHTDHFTHGDTLYAQCDSDYKIDNPSAWICQKGLWTSNVSFVPNCFTQGESCHNSCKSFSLLCITVCFCKFIPPNFHVSLALIVAF